MSQQREAISEDAMARIRKQFGPRLAARIEEWTLKVPYPASTLQLLTRTHLADHIRQVASVLGDAASEVSEEEIAKLVVFANEAIAREIDRKQGN